MPYQPIARYQLLPHASYSAYSRPARGHADGSYEIRLIKASDPHYIPGDMEIWPLYHQAINQALQGHPAAAQAAVEAYLKVRKEYEGRKNPDV